MIAPAVRASVDRVQFVPNLSDGLVTKEPHSPRVRRGVNVRSRAQNVLHAVEWGVQEFGQDANGDELRPGVRIHGLLLFGGDMPPTRLFPKSENFLTVRRTLLV
jgi:hypothetical protein